MSSAKEIGVKIDEMVDGHVDPKEIFDFIKKAMEEHSGEIDILWRWARAHFMLAEVSEKDKKYPLLVEGKKIATKCIELDSTHYGG
jgi:hypothetical protein